MSFRAEGHIVRLASGATCDMKGRLLSAVGLLLRASLPEARIGELCEIADRQLVTTTLAEVVGFRGDEALLMPLGRLEGIGSTCVVQPLGRALGVRVGKPLLGRILSGLGQPMDGRPLERGLDERSIDSTPPPPLERRLVSAPFATGVRAIDGFLTVGVGQRVGILAGAGVGKSTLLGMIARNSSADVLVIGLVGERGREVREFLERDLQSDTRERCVTVVATSDQAPLVRVKAAYVATTIAEAFRDEGLRVLLLLDSITRFARARREVGLALGEPPARAGFPPSVFADLPRLLERTGNSSSGSITAFYTVLVEGDDHNEPVADEARSILDGHIVLAADRAARGFFPAIDIAASASRVMSRVADASHVESARKLRSLLGTYEQERDLVLVGAYAVGTDPRVDEAIAKIDAIEEFLQQRALDSTPFENTVEWLGALARPWPLEEQSNEGRF